MKVKFCVLEKTFDVDIEMHFVCIWLIEGNVNSSDMWAGFNTDTITMPTFDNIKVVLGKLVQGRTKVKGSNVMALSMLIFWNPESNTNALTTCFFSENSPDK